jgi:hypothetical protein
MQERLQPRGEGDEDAEAEEHQAAQRAHLGDPPQRPRGTAGDRGVLIRRLTGAAQRHAQPDDGNHREYRLNQEQPLEVAVGCERRAQPERDEHPHEVAG